MKKKEEIIDGEKLIEALAKGVIILQEGLDALGSLLFEDSLEKI